MYLCVFIAQRSLCALNGHGNKYYPRPDRFAGVGVGARSSVVRARRCGRTPGRGERRIKCDRTKSKTYIAPAVAVDRVLFSYYRCENARRRRRIWKSRCADRPSVRDRSVRVWRRRGRGNERAIGGLVETSSSTHALPR